MTSTQLNDSDESRFRTLQRARMIIAALALFGGAEIAELGTPTSVLVLSAWLGVAIGGSIIRQLIAGTGLRRTLIVHLVAVCFLFAFLWGGDWLVTYFSSSADYDFLVTRIENHAVLTLAIYVLGLLSTVLFWTRSYTLTLEVFAAGLASLWLLSGHRNYQLDAPAALSDLAFNLGIDPQRFFLGIGVLVTAFLALYLFLAAGRPIFGAANPVPANGLRRVLQATAALVLFAGLFGGYTYLVDRRYSEQLSRASEGVGQSTDEGESPLGFHSAVGKTKQPAALVRLETGYEENPTNPMLYFREGALSEYNGREFVTASPDYDTDVPRAAPGQTFTSNETLDATNRKKVTQSVYLLSRHKSAFALDIPQHLRMMRNPDPQRFDMAYQAVSLAPTISSQLLIGEDVGDPNWTQSTRDHYLRAPGSATRSERQGDASTEIPETPILDSKNEDLRYERFARKILSSDDSPVAKADTIVKYLSTESIYTRKPGHQVTQGGDSVAPYLFAEEKRGYCVHFAHAAVYLMRLAGIPSRIATGYLTDLTYAKDGHILLHVGDRHAWPEIYVRGVGWTVLDVVPAQAENEQVIIPDEKLLDELMGKLDPLEELTPPPPEGERKPSLPEQIFDSVATKRNLVFGLLGVLVLWVLLKSWTRHAYRFARDDRRRVQLAYASCAATLADLGHPRRFGETRRDYAARVRATAGVDVHPVTDLNEHNAYAGTMSGATTPQAAVVHTRETLREHFPLWRRAIAFLSPRSIARIGRW
ncbi:MAG: transglutaminase domain-containing protein [Deltaproteobacteria bacterium]|nr:transglutaminase domain-containing protein [Deltaproteobacteria bacterium]